MSTKNILITGSNGFIGKNLIAALSRQKDIVIKTFDVDDDPGLLEAHLKEADFIYHFAGVNRPQDPKEFVIGNADSTVFITNTLEEAGRNVPILLTSSIQAELDNPYGKSKKIAEDILIKYTKRTGTPVFIYRLPGVFGKWSRPNYNTVVATFCHSIARGLEINISDTNNEIELVYIDDVVRHFMGHIKTTHYDTQEVTAKASCSVTPDSREVFQIFQNIDTTFKVTLGELAAKILSLHNICSSLTLPDLDDVFTRYLHATYLSFLPEDGFGHYVKLNTDSRGWLFELIKSPHFGQIFVSKTLPGVTRGNHYHDTKIEKFCVVQGKGIIRFRHILSKEVIEYRVDGKAIQIVDIPPGYTHSIENTGEDEMITLFWVNEIFDASKSDTYFDEVIQ